MSQNQIITGRFKWPLRAFPYVRLAGRFSLGDKDFSRTYDEGFNALYLHDYNGRARVGSHEFEFQRGDVTLSPAGLGVAFDIPEPGYNFCIHFDSEVGTEAEPVELPFHVPLDRVGDFALQRCWHIFNLLTMPKSKVDAETLSGAVLMGGLSRVANPSDDSLVQASASAALQDLLLWLALRSRYSGSKGLRGRSDQILDEAIEWMQNNLNQPLSVPALARQLGISHNYLASRFKAHFGVSIPRYFLTQRMDHAMHLLQSTSLPAKTIASQIGMPDAQHFNKQFRRLMGYSPSAVRTNEPGETS